MTSRPLNFRLKILNNPFFENCDLPTYPLTEQNLGNYSRVSITMTALQILSKLENLHVNVFVLLDV